MFTTTAYYIVCCAYLITIIVPFVDDNSQETRSLVPNLLSNERAMTTISISLKLIGNACPSYCALATSSIKISVTNLEVGTVAVQETRPSDCISEANNTVSFSRNCTVRYECKDCSFGKNDEALIAFEFSEPSTFAHGYEWNITTKSGYGKYSSSLMGFILSEPSMLFRGLQVPTRVIIATYQTVFKNSVNFDTTTGMHMDYISASIGDQVSSSQQSNVKCNTVLKTTRLLVKISAIKTGHAFISTW